MTANLQEQIAQIVELKSQATLGAGDNSDRES